DRHHFLFGDGIAHGVFAELHLAPDFSCALRNWHGRRMGTWRIPGDGNLADRSARVVLGDPTAGLRFWLSVGGSRLLGGVSVLRLARTVCGGYAAGVPCHFYSRAGAGIAGMAAPAHRGDCFLEKCADRPATALGPLSFRVF